MSRYALFLRGVNVGGITLKMADVADTLTQAGFGDVKTILASGNVLVDHAGNVTTVRTKAEAALRNSFDYEAWVLAYDLPTVRAVSEAYPFAREVEGHHSYVTFVADDAVLGELAALAAPGEPIQRGDGVVYWQIPRAATTTSTMGKTMSRARFRSSTTTRNLRTVDRVLAS